MKDSDLPAKNCAPVTVIIPAYNVESCLERAVWSVLEQEPPPLEVIVINDGSTDKTVEVAGGFGARIRYLEQTNKGPAAARNAGLAVATGKYVAFLDADDYWLPGFIQATVAFMEAHPDAVAVSTGWRIQPLKGSARMFPSTENPLGIAGQGDVLENFFEFWGQYDHVRTGTVLMRRSLLGVNGFQRTDLRICEDLEFWAWLGTLGPWGFIPRAFWFGDSARVAAQGGWLEKYRTRRKMCPTVEMWQKRLLSKVNSVDRPGFRKIRGRVAASYVQNMILGGQYGEAANTLRAYAPEMPLTWMKRLLMLGARLGNPGWAISCGLVRLREFQKAFLLEVKRKLPGEIK